MAPDDAENTRRRLGTSRPRAGAPGWLCPIGLAAVGVRWTPRCCRNGRWRRSRPAGCCRGCRSPSAPASRSISPPTASRPGGRRASLALATIAIAVVARRRPFGFPLALAVAAIATGFCVATLQTARIAHPVLQSVDLERAGLGLCRNPRGARTQRPHRRARQPLRRAARHRKAGTRAGRGAQGHRAGGRQLRRVQGASVAAAAAAAARRLRLRARHVFPADRRLRLCARQDQDRAAAGRARPVAALRRLHRRHARRHQPAHSHRAAGRPRLDRLGADHRQTQRDFASRSTTPSMSRAWRMCWRSPASTWRWWPASCSSVVRAGLALVPSLAIARPIKKWAALGRACSPRRSIC